MRSLIVGVLLLGVPFPAAAQGAKYGVKSRVDKSTNFSTLKTYAWTTGWSAFNRSVDKQLIAAIDRELAGLGFAKLASQPADVLVSYAAIPRTDVDVKSKQTGNPPLYREYPAGTLVIRLLEPGTLRELFWAKADAKLGPDPALVGGQLDALVPKMFKKYRTRIFQYR